MTKITTDYSLTTECDVIVIINANIADGTATWDGMCYSVDRYAVNGNGELYNDSLLSYIRNITMNHPKQNIKITLTYIPFKPEYNRAFRYVARQIVKGTFGFNTGDICLTSTNPAGAGLIEEVAVDAIEERENVFSWL